MKKMLLLIILLVSTSDLLYSQIYLDSAYSNRFGIGVILLGGLNYHTANFKGIDFPNIPSCCPRYENGSGLNYFGGLGMNLAISERLGVQLLSGYQNLSATLTKREPEYFSTTDQGGVWGEFEHSVKSTLNTVNASLLVGYRLTPRMNLLFGPSFDILIRKEFEQKEEIVSPSYGFFKDGNQFSRVRNRSQGEIPNASALIFGARVGANYYFPLNSSYTIFLVPQIFFDYGISEVAKNHKWQAHSLSGGLGIIYAPRRIKYIPPPPPPPINPPLPKFPTPPTAPMLDASITAVSLDERGSEHPVTMLKIEEYLSTKMHPILGYIFFDENSSEIPQRYRRISPLEAKTYNIRKLYGLGTLEIYYDVINIIGKRVSQYPQAELTIIGFNSNQGAEAGNIELSRRRAEAVKNYLVSVWGIEPERLKIEARNLPDIPSNPNDPDGIAENRRVEIRANIPQIFEPLVVEDTLREVNPPRFRFKPVVHSAIGVDKWQLITSQSEGIVKVFEGSGDIPPVIEWDISYEQKNVPKLDEPLSYKLVVVDKDNKQWESKTLNLPVEIVTVENKIIEQIADKQIDRFSLILFEFGQSDVTGENLKIAEIAKKRIKPTSTVKIEGYTDRIGDERTNLELSQKRAVSTAKVLGVDTKFARGLGESKLLYNNDLPEGRVYCRTVNIEIVTPIE